MEQVTYIYIVNQNPGLFTILLFVINVNTTFPYTCACLYIAANLMDTINTLSAHNQLLHQLFYWGIGQYLF